MRKVKDSLIYEIVAFIFTLISLLTLGILIPFARYRIHTIEKTLTFELQSRMDMLLSAISVGAEIYMPTGNTMELSLLASKISDMPVVKFTTVTGFCVDDDIHQNFSNRSSSHSYLHVWTTNDESILQKIDTQEFIPGVSCLVSEQFIQFDELCHNLNEEVSLFL